MLSFDHVDTNLIYSNMHIMFYPIQKAPPKAKLSKSQLGGKCPAPPTSASYDFVSIHLDPSASAKYKVVRGYLNQKCYDQES